MIYIIFSFKLLTTAVKTRKICFISLLELQDNILSSIVIALTKTKKYQFQIVLEGYCLTR